MLIDRMTPVRCVCLALLLLMVARGLGWLLDPPAEATGQNYALQIGTTLICAATAWVTWRPNARLDRKMAQRLGRGW